MTGKSAPFIIVFAILAVFSAPASSAESVQDAEREAFEGGAVPADWKAGGIPGDKPHGASLRIAGEEENVHGGSGALAFVYPLRNVPVPVLIHAVDLHAMTSLAFWIRSPEATTWVTAVKDADGAVFNAPVSLPAGRWKKVVLRPGSFRLNDDSPVKKDRLDPGSLGRGYVGFDLAAVLGKGSTREVFLDDVAVTRGTFAVFRGGLVCEAGEKTLSEPTRIEGNLVVRKGASLTVTAERLEVTGDVLVEGGRLALRGGRWRIPQDYRYQRTIAVTGGGALSLASGQLDVGFPVSSNLSGESTLRAEGVSMASGHFTLGVQKGSSVRFTDSKGLGEFIVQRGSAFEVAGCEGILVWLQCMEGDEAQLRLPGKKVDVWRSPEGLGRDLVIRDSTGMVFGLLAGEGADLTFEDSSLFAAGVMFMEAGPWKVEGLKNGSNYDDFRLETAGASLRFENSRVRAWNFYTMGIADLEIRDCVYGESISFHRSRIRAFGSVCDGTGGYLGARDHSTTIFTGGRAACEVLAHDDARMELRDTKVSGDVRATRTSRIRLDGVEVEGRVVEAEEGRIEKKEKD